MEQFVENRIIDQLAAAIAGYMPPTIPLSVALWSLAEIAAFLKMSPHSVRQRIVPLPGFPQAIRLPSGKTKPHPRWKAKEVIAWADKHQERRVA